MSDNKYIIKNLNPWMLDELIAFSEFTKFDVIFLRNQDEFYKDGLKKIQKKGIKVYFKPYNGYKFFSKLFFILSFFLKNISLFSFNYNFVLGVKSIVWFLLLDIRLFSKSSNIHAQFATQASIIALLIKKYYNNKPKFSFTFHAYDIYFYNKWLVPLINDSLNSFSISKFNIKYLINNYKKFNKNKIVLSRLGVFKSNTRMNKKIGNYIYIGFLSWFVEKKGIEYLIDAIEIFKLKKPKKYKFILAGDGPLRDKIKRKIKEKKLNDIIENWGRLDNSGKILFFKKIDVFILPSITLKNDFDCIPVVLMEAVSFGKPIISTNISGIPEICIDGFNGKLIKEKSVVEIVKAIEFFNTSDVIKNYGLNSLKVAEKYDIVKNSKIKLKRLEWI